MPEFARISGVPKRIHSLFGTAKYSMLFSFYFVAYAASASAAPSVLWVLAAMTRRALMATLTMAETGEPPPTIAQVRLIAASTRLMILFTVMISLKR